MLKSAFSSLLSKYTTADTIARLWSEIEEQYSGKKKHYHTLLHLENLLRELTEVKSAIQDWDTILFTLFYHDIIYNAVKQDNEEQSAELAGKRMLQAGVPDQMSTRCRAQIMATKKHLYADDPDTNYFTDADLSILGQDWDAYLEYSGKVRKEYALYPDMVYNAGRRKALKHFLAMDRIFKTDHFYVKYEGRAKLNIFKELQSL